MKKLLIATTALVATAASAQMVAAQNVNISGYGRFGLDYNNGRYDGGLLPDPTLADTQVQARLRFNIDASVDTDAGVTFGGRIRMQWDNGRSNSVNSPAYLFAAANGFRVEVGNSNTAIDSVALMYNSEIGAFNRSLGGPLGSFNAFSTGGFGALSDRMGVFASYSVDGLNVRASYLTPDQTLDTLPAFVNEELSVSADYNFGDFTVAAAYASNSGFVDGLDEWFLGAEYAIIPGANVGLLYSRAEFEGDNANLVTLYGNYRVDAITYRGYIARANQAGANAKLFGQGADIDVDADTRTVFGLGMDYDLGGARLGADIHRNYNKDTIAGLGVRFNF